MPQSATYGKKRRRCLLEGAFTCGLWSPQAQLVANGEVVRAQAVTHDDLILLVELIIVESEFPTQPQKGWLPLPFWMRPADIDLRFFRMRSELRNPSLYSPVAHPMEDGPT